SAATATTLSPSFAWSLARPARLTASSREGLESSEMNVRIAKPPCASVCDDTELPPTLVSSNGGAGSPLEGLARAGATSASGAANAATAQQPSNRILNPPFEPQRASIGSSIMTCLFGSTVVL